MTSGLLGDQYVGIEAGYGETVWQPNEQVSNTQSAVILENLIGQFINSKALEVGSSGAEGKTEAAAETTGTGAGEVPAINPHAGGDVSVLTPETDAAAEANGVPEATGTTGAEPQPCRRDSGRQPPVWAALTMMPISSSSTRLA